jgi:hypothetical protein
MPDVREEKRVDTRGFACIKALQMQHGNTPPILLDRSSSTVSCFHAQVRFQRSEPAFAYFDPKRLVRAAHVGVVARADSSSRLAVVPGGRTFPVVHFSVIETINAGSMKLPSDLRISGGLTTRSEFNQDPVPYRWVRPSGQGGSYFSSEYQQGGEFLLLLRGPSADLLSPYWAPLAPTNEQVHGRDDAWVTWVRRARNR